jgi:hypothetical protein
METEKKKNNNLFEMELLDSAGAEVMDGDERVAQYAAQLNKTVEQLTDDEMDDALSQ